MLPKRWLLAILVLSLFFYRPPVSLADCGESPGGSLTISGACSFAAPCTSTTATGCNYNGVDNGGISVGATGALTINAGQTIYFNPGQSVSITSGGYINIGKSGSVTGALSKGYLWLPGSGTTITSSQPAVTSTTSAPGGGYIRRYTASSIYCAAAQSCPTACGYAGGTVPGGTATDGTCLTTTCAATASCCSPNQGQSCNCNACGSCGGTYDCAGNCPGGTPAVPTWYQDADGDGYGNPGVSTQACSQPAGYVSNNTDCYDSNASAHPGQTSYFATNRGDGSFDYDCDGQTTRNWDPWYQLRSYQQTPTSCIGGYNYYNGGTLADINQLEPVNGSCGGNYAPNINRSYLTATCPSCTGACTGNTNTCVGPCVTGNGTTPVNLGYNDPSSPKQVLCR